MADAPLIHAPRDRGRINLAEPREVRFWTQALDVSEARLRSAVSAAGDATPAVRQYLCGHTVAVEPLGTGWSSSGWGSLAPQRQQQA